jgi:hypothetical protein
MLMAASAAAVMAYPTHPAQLPWFYSRVQQREVQNSEALGDRGHSRLVDTGNAAVSMIAVVLLLLLPLCVQRLLQQCCR